MPEYCFYEKGKQVIVLESADMEQASQLTQQGYEKQFEEVYATTEQQALARFADIRKNNRTDHHNFLSGAIAMPLIGALTAVAVFLLRKKKP